MIICKNTQLPCFLLNRPCPNEPSRLKATLPQNTLKLGQVMTEPICEFHFPCNFSFFLLCTLNDLWWFCPADLNLVDQYDNETRRLTPSCVKDMTVEAEGLDKSKISFAWQVGTNINTSTASSKSGPQ